MRAEERRLRLQAASISAPGGWLSSAAKEFGHTSTIAGFLHADVTEDETAKLLFVVGIAAEPLGRCLEAVLAPDLREVLVLAIGRSKPLPANELVALVAGDGKRWGCYDADGKRKHARAVLRDEPHC